MDYFCADIYTVVTIYFLNLVHCYNIGAVNAQEFVRWQHLLDSLHGQMRNQWLFLTVKIEHYIIFHAVDIDNLVNGDIPPFAINSDENGVGLLFGLDNCLLGVKQLSSLLY